MKEVIKQIEGLYDCLVKENNLATVLTAKLNEGMGMVEKGKGENASQKENLDKREKGISGIEDVQRLNTETIEAQKKLVTDQGQLKIEKDAFESYQAQEKEANGKLRTNLESGLKACSLKEDELEQSLKDLEERKKNLVEEVTKEIMSKK